MTVLSVYKIAYSQRIFKSFRTFCVGKREEENPVGLGLNRPSSPFSSRTSGSSFTNKDLTGPVIDDSILLDKSFADGIATERNSVTNSFLLFCLNLIC